MKTYRFERDLSRAHTLPADWYVDPAVLEREHERVFARTWQLAGHAEQVSAGGDYFTTSLGREPLIVVRGADHVLRAFSAVCRHRAGPVAQGCGRRASFQCAYHGWTYGQDGRLLSAPEWDGVRNFDRAATVLPPAQVEAWGAFVFVNLDLTAAPLAKTLGAIASDTSGLPHARMRTFKRVDYRIQCNWKVYVDNYLEGYHIPLVHPGLFRQLDYRRYRVESLGLYSKQHAPIRTGTADSLFRDSAPRGSRPRALYYWVFPNVMLNFYPDNLQVNTVVPITAEETLTRFEWFALETGAPRAREALERSIAFADEVQREDVAICETVQRGLRSATYDQGRYSVRRENGVHHFHGLLARYLGRSSPR